MVGEGSKVIELDGTAGTLGWQINGQSFMVYRKLPGEDWIANVSMPMSDLPEFEREAVRCSKSPDMAYQP
jgi:hypothetical protein